MRLGVSSGYLRPLILVAVLLIGVSSGARPVFGQSVQAISTTGCNNDSYAPVPGSTTDFIGRRLLALPSGSCTGSNYTLSWYQMDWSTNTMNLKGDILPAPATVNGTLALNITDRQGDTITSAYDPTVISYNNALWIAFECVGTGPNLTNTVSVCIAPTQAFNNYQINTALMTIPVSGQPLTNSAEGHTAGVPKIFLFGGQPYLYWSTVHLVNGVDGPLWTDITTRGAGLTQATSSLPGLWVSGAGTAAVSSNGSMTTEVFGLTPSDPLSNGVADSSGVAVLGGRILLTANVGGKGCTSPISPVFGCYRLEIHSATTPLGTDIFNASVVNSPAFFFNPQEYTRFVQDPSGTNFLMGQYLTPITNGTPAPTPTIGAGQTGFLRYQEVPASFTYGSSLASPQPNPAGLYAYFGSNFTVLQQFNSQCSANNPNPDSSNGACFAAVDQYCQSQGYGAGGLLEQYANGNNNLLCATATGLHALRKTISVSTLTAYNSSCTAGNMISDSCQSAIGAYCSALPANGGAPYVAGFGPMEFANGTVIVTCVDSTVATVVSSNFTTLSAQNPQCTSASRTSSLQCYAATDAVCRASGRTAGFGIVNHAGNTAILGCMQ